ncbi:unnamed protein product [Amaranthus hypochondriacus]
MKIVGKKFGSLLVVIYMMIVIFALVQNVHGEGEVICGIPVTSLLPCLPSVKLPNPTPPSAICCGALKQADEKCLCGYATSPLLRKKYGINKALFLALPGKCGLPNCP